MNPVLDAIPDVEIDENGVFKYILIRVGYMNKVKTIVRGYDSEYHADIDDEVQEKLLSSARSRKEIITVTCLGGAFIERNSAEKTIQIFGKAVGIGDADHNLTLELLEKAFPDYHIEITNRE